MTLEESCRMVDQLIGLDVNDPKELELFVNSCLTVGAVFTATYIVDQIEADGAIEKHMILYNLEKDITET